MTVKNFSINEIYESPINKYLRNYVVDNNKGYNYLWGKFFIDGYRFLPIEKNTFSTSLDLFTILNRKKYDFYFSKSYFDFLKKETKSFKVIKNSFIVGSDENYFHNLIYHLPRIVSLINNDQLLCKIDSLVFNEDLPDYLITLLNEILKFKQTNKKLILIKKSTYLFENSYCPIIVSRGKNIRESVSFWKHIISNISNTIKTNNFLGDKIYISRQDSKKRKILNENELIPLLKDLNYQIVTLSEMNIFDQINLFKNAKIIIGYHGAAFANLVFSLPKTKVIEIHPHPDIDLRTVTKEIADINGLEHNFFFVDYKSNIKNSKNMTYFDGIVDVEKFKNLIINL